MTHHYLALERTYCFKRYTYYDEYRCTTDGDSRKRRYAQSTDNGEDGDNSEEYSADKCDLVERVVDKVGSGLSGAIAGDSAVILLQIVGYLNRIILNGYIEIVKRNDKQEVQYSIRNAAGAEESYETMPEARTRTVYTEEAAYRLGQCQDRHCEDDRHNA